MIVIGMHSQEMIDWFLAHYADPAEFIPFDSKEGGYQYFGNGPYDALEVLTETFQGKFAKNKIREVAEDLTEQSGEWAAIPDATAL